MEIEDFSIIFTVQIKYSKMKLTNNAIMALKGNTRLKALLSLGLGKTIHTIERWIENNEPNGDLTKAAAIQVIREETGLSDTDIIEETDRIAV